MTNYLEDWEFLNPKNPFIPQFFVLTEAKGDFKDTQIDLVLKIVSQAFRLSKDQKEIELYVLEQLGFYFRYNIMLVSTGIKASTSYVRHI
jgi:hypothetical protein